MKKHRAMVVSLLLMMLLLCVAARLYQLQIASSPTFSKERENIVTRAFEAQSQEILLNSGRGKILDRFGRPFVGVEKDRLLLFPQTEDQWVRKRARYTRLAQLIGYQESVLNRLLTTSKHPIIIPARSGGELIVSQRQQKEIQSLRLPGVIVAQTDNRTTVSPRIGQQILGRIIRNPFLVRENFPKEYKLGLYSGQSRIGFSGLEASFEKYLHGSGEKILGYLQTRKGEPLTGAKYKMIDHRERVKSQPYQLRTTLDAKLQQGIERLMKRDRVQDGAIVVQEIQSGDILAMGSAPFIGSGNEEQSHPWDNRALMEATPGSIFKTIVAIAALEEGRVSPYRHFICKGKLDHYHMRDERTSGHGETTLIGAYAQSCNVIMAKVAKLVGGEKIEEYARRFGFGQKILWHGALRNQKQFAQEPNEQHGMIFASKELKKDVGAVMQTAIGQRDVKITPIQAANLVTSLFHQGKALQPRLVTEIQKPNGKPYFYFHNQYIERAKPLRLTTCQWLKQSMEEVVEEGTARILRNHQWKLAGKTGTAQVGIDKKRYNKWMIGYGPVENPRYSVAILLRGVKESEDRRAKLLFAQTMDLLKKLEEKRQK
ncbi:Cell division protein FtsI/penicillin-binding protein 2 [Seinonella peptonophila]|uniref:Cell division protein FtsI/penicillin-binding protein 2 n=1 Tax=Seinonella peptonophila TaxID=112248 RepID=A0A1M4W9E8_9BACL|nr:penicillin-binding transpeptidase domain-containing protein [Seinonella peptonophila]SHE77864.1 Cell division protein FtsI/penicillin-binding protein 2 [Seinonella peptonophila]